MAFSLVAAGYQFGRGNHHVYLLDAFRRNDPTLFANDWYVTQTLQYHGVFNRVAEGLIDLGMLQAGFFAFFLALVAFLHVGWYWLVRQLGGNSAVYLLSAVIFHIFAAGTVPGLYHFLQDGSFLPSNVAAVAMLWAIVLWNARFPVLCGLLLGLAGLWHLNYAVVSVGLWVVLVGCYAFLPGQMPIFRGRPGSATPPPTSLGRLADRRLVLGTLLATVPSLVNIALALQVKLANTGTMPHAEFVNLYARLRHGHHYDPLALPTVLWVIFLLPLPTTWLAWYISRPAGTHVFARREAAKVFLYFGVLLAVSFVFAGVWFVSEALIQMSMWRFAVFVKLLSCIATAWLLLAWRPWLRRATLAGLAVLAVVVTVGAATLHMPRAGPFIPEAASDYVTRIRPAIWLGVALLTASALWLNLAPRLARRRQRRLAFGGVAAVGLFLAAFATNPEGMTTPPPNSPEMIALGDFARDNTPRDALFLTPPDDASFRLLARRATVITFKSVPQLNGELPAWRDRLQDVLGLSDLMQLPRPYELTLPAIARRYDSLPAEHLLDVAEQYDARYLVTRVPLNSPQLQLAWTASSRRLYLYDRTDRDRPGVAAAK